MDTPHFNPAFDVAISKMDNILIQMESVVHNQLSAIHEVFLKKDVALAKVVRKRDSEVNKLQAELENHVVLILAKHQPVAEDLRHTVCTLKMGIEYERAGDYVKNLAKSISRMAVHDEKLTMVPAFVNVTEKIILQFNQFCDARKNDNIELAEKVWVTDIVIDDLCSDVIRDAFKKQKHDDCNIHSLVHSVNVAKNIERFGDKVKNLVEIFYYAKTGEQLNIILD